MGRSLSSLVRRIGVGGSYLVGHLTRRDPRVWVFGNLKGFHDNPRYLAEHVALKHRDVEAWWIARSDLEADRARAAGLRVAMRDRAGRDVQRRAGVAFLSNGFRDLQAAHLGGAYVVDLRHGQGTKPILLEARYGQAPGGPPIRRLARWVRRHYVRHRLGQIDMIVAPGERERAMYVKSFGGSPSRIRVLGTPRFDVLLGGEAHDRVAGGDLRGRLGLEHDDFAALWLPTWRQDGDSSWLPALTSAELDRALEGTRIVLLVKLHPYSDPAGYLDKLPSHPRIRWIPDGDEDVNCLLRVADTLITDYSSAAFDFALLDRPIVFFAPDLDGYRSGHGLLPAFERLVVENNHVTWDALLGALRERATARHDDHALIARRIRAMSKNMDAPGSSERIARAVAEAVGLDLGAAS